MGSNQAGNLEELKHHRPKGENLSMSELQQEYMIVHNESRRLQNKVEECQANQLLLNATHSDMEMAECEAKAKMDRNIQYTKDLQQLQKQCWNEGTLIEKKIQEGIVKNIADEQGMEFHMRQVAFEGERREQRQRQKEISVEEQRERDDHSRTTDDRCASVVAERERKILDRENQSKMLGDRLVAGGVARQEREHMMSMIQEMECYEKKEEYAVSERKRVEESRDEIERSNISQVKFRKTAAKELEKEEDRFRKEFEKQMALEDEQELEKERKKREKNQQYFLDLQAQIADNARRRQADKELEQTRDQEQFDYNQEWRSQASEGQKVFLGEYEVPQQASSQHLDVVKHDDNVRESERQLAVEDELELEKDRKKKEKNHQYFLDLQEQIADNARRRLADRELDQGLPDYDQNWRAEASDERRKVTEEKEINVQTDDGGLNAQPVMKMRADKPEDLTKFNN